MAASSGDRFSCALLDVSGGQGYQRIDYALSDAGFISETVQGKTETLIVTYSRISWSYLPPNDAATRTGSGTINTEPDATQTSLRSKTRDAGVAAGCSRTGRDMRPRDAAVDARRSAPPQGPLPRGAPTLTRRGAAPRSPTTLAPAGPPRPRSRPRSASRTLRQVARGPCGDPGGPGGADRRGAGARCSRSGPHLRASHPLLLPPPPPQIQPYPPRLPHLQIRSLRPPESASTNPWSEAEPSKPPSAVGRLIGFICRKRPHDRHTASPCRRARPQRRGEPGAEGGSPQGEAGPDPVDLPGPGGQDEPGELAAEVDADGEAEPDGGGGEQVGGAEDGLPADDEQDAEVGGGAGEQGDQPGDGEGQPGSGVPAGEELAAADSVTRQEALGNGESTALVTVTATVGLSPALSSPASQTQTRAALSVA